MRAPLVHGLVFEPKADFPARMGPAQVFFASRFRGDVTLSAKLSTQGAVEIVPVLFESWNRGFKSCRPA